MQLTRAFVAIAFTATLSVASVTQAHADEGDLSPGERSPPIEPPAPSDRASASTAKEEAPLPATSNVDVRVSTEVAAYQDSVAVSVLTPSASATVKNVTSGWAANGRYLVDVVSAASPDIVSTASSRWVEVRHAGNLGASYKPGDFGVALTGSASYTPDYLALSAACRLTQDLDEKNLTLTEGYGYGHDTIGRTGTPFSVFSRTLDYHTVTAGLSSVVNTSLVLGLIGELTLERGDQSKPYRYIPMFLPQVAPTIPRGASVDTVKGARLSARPLEQLPLGRERYSLSGRLAWRLGYSTLRLDERGYVDSWGLRASTTDLKWMFDAGERVIVWPHVRAHLQSGVSFWERAYIARDVHDLPALRTGDRELSPLASAGVGGGVRMALGRSGHIEDWVLTGMLEGTYTSFFDAIYVLQRYSALASVGLEVGF
jgi:hypothetical protein